MLVNVHHQQHVEPSHCELSQCLQRGGHHALECPILDEGRRTTIALGPFEGRVDEERDRLALTGQRGERCGVREPVIVLSSVPWQSATLGPCSTRIQHFQQVHVVFRLVGQRVVHLSPGLQRHPACPQDISLPQPWLMVLQSVQLLCHPIAHKHLHVLDVCGQSDHEDVQEEFVRDLHHQVAIMDGMIPTTTPNARLCGMFDGV